MQNMNGMKTIGTVIGGILSISSMIFFTVFISAQLYLWLLQPAYSRNSDVKFLSRVFAEEDKYTVPVHKLMPAFAIMDNAVDSAKKPIYNDKSRWSFKYVQFGANFSEEDNVFDAIPCDDMISKMDNLPEA